MIGLVSEVLHGAGITGPPVRLPLVNNALGIVVEPYWDAPRAYDASLVRYGSKKLCWYNPRKIDTRIRFSIAHEIGHCLMHQMQWNGEIPPYDPQMEREADAFAAELLMPTKWMLDICAERASFDDLRHLFWVSKQAMARRLSDLGLYIPITRYEKPSIAPWPVIEREKADPIYRPWLSGLVTGDPYGDYLLARGVARSTPETAQTVSGVESFP